jgi:hypothetical protein
MLQASTYPVDDRRAANRPANPVCRTCDGSEVKAVLRTEMAVYFRCHSCNIVWGEAKPHASGFVRDWIQGQRGRLRSRERQKIILTPR